MWVRVYANIGPRIDAMGKLCSEVKITNRGRANDGTLLNKYQVNKYETNNFEFELKLHAVCVSPFHYIWRVTSQSMHGSNV